MKKVLATAGALMLAGTMVSSALAAEAKKVEPGVSFSGDARVRYRVRDNYYTSRLTQSDAKDQWDSRVRIVAKAVAKGGSFAEMRFRADASPWEGELVDAIYDGRTYEGADSYSPTNSNDVWADYYFMHVPLGDSGWAFRGGVQNVGFTPFLSDDERTTRANFDYKSGSLMVKLLVDVYMDDPSAAWGDEDYKGYATIIEHKTDSLKVKGTLRYNSDERSVLDKDGTLTYEATAADGTVISFPLAYNYTVPNTSDKTGFIGDVHTEVKLNETSSLTGEIAYKEADAMRGSQTRFDDDGWGAFVQYGMKMNALSIDPVLGYTAGGFTADETFGFIMIGGDEPIMAAKVGNALGESWFAGLPVRYKAAEKLTLKGNLAYFDFDVKDPSFVPATTNSLTDAMEISGALVYDITQGAAFTWMLGYLMPSVDGPTGEDDALLGTYGKFEIKF